MAEAEPITSSTLPEQARRVELPVCPTCGLVGKQPGGSQVAFMCSGGFGKHHKRVKMQEIAYEPMLDELPPDPPDPIAA